MNNPRVFSNPCAICRVREATKLCDYVTGYNNSPIFVNDYKKFCELNSGCRHETCDLPMCGECAKQMGLNVDFCPHHYKLHIQAELPAKLKQAQIRQKSKQYYEMEE
uniref:Uncharacterized protein n=1 Tax=Halalkalibacterium halodurans TaxID=86665 RepID=A0A0M0KM17_ALKHA